MGDGWHLRRRGMAGRPASRRRRLHAHRILRWDFSGGPPELFDRKQIWMALDVRGWRDARPFAGVGAPRGHRTGAMAEEGKSRQYVADLAAFRNAIFQCLPPP